LTRFLYLVNNDTEFLERLIFYNNEPILVYKKAKSRFIQSSLYKELLTTGIRFKIISRKEADIYGI